MSKQPELLDAIPVANTLTALAAITKRTGDAATLLQAAELILHLRQMVIEQTLDRAVFDLASRIKVDGLHIHEATHIAQLCHIASTLQESNEDQSVGLVLQVAGHIIDRQQLMLEQAKLVPRQDFGGRAH